MSHYVSGSAPIHPDDDMYAGSLVHYEACGAQFADFAERAAGMTGASSPQILELPCGYGRVTRHLVKRFEPSHIVVADLMAPAADFAAQTFGVKAYPITEPINEFHAIPEGFDLTLMGSLITHLSERDALTVLTHFLGKLAPGGVAVITTTGMRAHEMLQADEWFKFYPEDRTALLEAYAHDQFGFANYRAAETFEKKTVDALGKYYGLSLIPRAWMQTVLERLGFTVLQFEPGAWDNHQDVFYIGHASF